jgi:hypothetical protein
VLSLSLYPSRWCAFVCCLSLAKRVRGLTWIMFGGMGIISREQVVCDNMFVFYTLWLAQMNGFRLFATSGVGFD